MAISLIMKSGSGANSVIALADDDADGSSPVAGQCDCWFWLVKY
jgi:hypothetical protein